MMNSRGEALGSTLVSFVAIIAIMVILGGFILISGIIKAVDRVDSGIRIHDESDTGIKNLFGYEEDLIEFETFKKIYAGGEHG